MSMDKNKIRIIPPGEWVTGGLQAYDEAFILGKSTGWKNMDPFFRVALGQLTAITGFPGHGKSEIVDDIAVNMAITQGWRTAFLSPENFPNRRHVRKLAEKMARQRARNMGRAKYMQTVNEPMTQFFEFLELGDDGANLFEVLAVVKEMKVDMLVIDPWNHLEINLPRNMLETDYIKLALKYAQRFARLTNRHVFIVAHPAKPPKDKEGKRMKPSAYDLAGSAHWFNLCDNILMAYRNAEDTELCSLKVKFQPENGIPGVGKLKFDPQGFFRDTRPEDYIKEALEKGPSKPPISTHVNGARLIGPADARFRPSGMPDGDE